MLNKLLILVTLCVYCKGTNVGDSVFRNDYKYYDQANGWLKLHVAPLNWARARFQCTYEGAILVSPFNAGILSGIEGLLQEERPIRKVFFSGVSASFGRGIYQSIDGVKIDDMPIHWSKNEPALPNGCLVFNYNSGTMESKDCTDTYPFICYKENKAKMVRNECGTIDNGYQRIERSSKCYKYHPEPTDWEQAFKICHAEGGWLVIHDDYMKKDFGQSKSQIFYVGYKLFNDVWWDVKGKPMEPYRTGKTYDCGARTWEGKFLGMDCDEHYPFLCEKEAHQVV